MKRIIFLIPFLLISCTENKSIEHEEYIPPTYSLIMDGRIFKNLTLTCSSTLGDTFKLPDGRRITFRGQYYFYEETIKDD